MEDDPKNKQDSPNKTLSSSSENEASVPNINWIIPVHDSDRVRQEKLSSSVTGVYSVRVSIREIEERDSGNFTCKVPSIHQSAVTEVIVVHRNVVQHCGLASFLCSTGECIPTRFVCDNKPDCPEGTDELQSTCGTDKL